MPEQVPQTSPRPARKPGSETLDFPEACRALIEGRKITRLEWNDRAIYGWLDGGRVRIMLKDGKHDWILSDGDVLATDWVSF